jgi:hypothetical protein
LDGLRDFVARGAAAQVAAEQIVKEVAPAEKSKLDDALLDADVALKAVWHAMLVEFRREMAALLDARLPRR